MRGGASAKSLVTSVAWRLRWGPPSFVQAVTQALGWQQQTTQGNLRKTGRMLAGFNHNLRHRELVFHVQTEDGGLRDPRVVTQLFLGGRLLSVRRWSYHALLESGAETASVEQVVRTRMMSQHKGMLRAVVEGDFDRAAGLSPSPPEISDPVPPEAASGRAESGGVQRPADVLGSHAPAADEPPADAPRADEPGARDAPRLGAERPAASSRTPLVTEARRSERGPFSSAGDSSSSGSRPAPRRMPARPETRAGFDGLDAGTEDQRRSSDRWAQGLEASRLSEDELLAEIDAELRRHDKALWTLRASIEEAEPAPRPAPPGPDTLIDGEPLPDAWYRSRSTEEVLNDTIPMRAVSRELIAEATRAVGRDSPFVDPAEDGPLRSHRIHLLEAEVAKRLDDSAEPPGQPSAAPHLSGWTVDSSDLVLPPIRPPTSARGPTTPGAGRASPTPTLEGRPRRSSRPDFAPSEERALRSGPLDERPVRPGPVDERPLRSGPGDERLAGSAPKAERLAHPTPMGEPLSRAASSDGHLARKTDGAGRLMGSVPSDGRLAKTPAGESRRLAEAPASEGLTGGAPSDPRKGPVDRAALKDGRMDPSAVADVRPTGRASVDGHPSHTPPLSEPLADPRAAKSALPPPPSDATERDLPVVSTSLIERRSRARLERPRADEHDASPVRPRKSATTSERPAPPPGRGTLEREGALNRRRAREIGPINEVDEVDELHGLGDFGPGGPIERVVTGRRARPDLGRVSVPRIEDAGRRSSHLVAPTLPEPRRIRDANPADSMVNPLSPAPSKADASKVSARAGPSPAEPADSPTLEDVILDYLSRE